MKQILLLVLMISVDAMSVTVEPSSATQCGKWTTLSCIGKPDGRHETTFVECEGKFYLIGGRESRKIDRFDPQTNTWTKMKATSPLIHHFQPVLWNNKIYMVGAMTGGYPKEPPMTHIQIYDPIADKWTEGSEIPSTRRRGSAGTVLYNGKIYMVGGITLGHTSGTNAWFDEYDPKTNTWTQLPDAPHIRDHFHAVVLDDKLYCLGGRNTSHHIPNFGSFFAAVIPEIDVYDFKTGTWSVLEGSAGLPQGSAAGGTAALDDCIVYFGGETDKDALSGCWAFNPKTKTWKTLASLNQGRHGSQAIVFENRIYIAAGSPKRGGGCVDSIEMFSKGVSSYAWGYKNNRIAITADGNSARDNAYKWPTGDPDDWGATAASLAIIAKLGLQDKLVHYSYNNFIDSPPGPDHNNQMKISADGGIERWNFDGNKFYDVTTQLAEARSSLAAEMSKSTVLDPLYVILAGLSEFLYQAVDEVVQQGHEESLEHVYLVSHSGFNYNEQRRKYHRTWGDTQKRCNNRIHYHKIPDQNDKNNAHHLWHSGRDFSVWYWMRDHHDADVRWMYDRLKAHSGGVADISDCGMLFYLLCGDDDGSPLKFKAFIGDGISPH